MATQSAAVEEYTAPPLHPVEDDTLTKLFFRPIDEEPDGEGVRWLEGGEWRSLSRREVLERVERTAAALEGLGVERGDRVAILSENRPEWAITDYAVLGLGAMDVPVYATLPPNQIAYILDDAAVKVVCVSTREQLAKILEVRAEVPSLEQIVAYDDPGGEEGVLHFSALLERGAERMASGEASPFRERALSVGRDNVATLIYTSGTTGNPKGVMLTHFNLASNVAAVDQHHVIEVHPGDVALSFLPLSHVFERMVDYFYWGSAFAIAYVGDMDRVAESLLEVRPHVMVSVPRVFEKIYAKVMAAGGVKHALVLWAKRVGEAFAERQMAGEPVGTGLAVQNRIADRLVFSKLRERTGGRLRLAISGGAPLAPDIARFFFGAGLPIYEGYGLTETSPVISVNRPGAAKIGTVGPMVPGTEVRIAEGGEILARGPQVMKGYWKRDDATAGAIDADGWIHTGDVGELDAEGFLRITDRVKNLLVTAGGKNIAPQPIENQVLLSPFIAQTVMLGDKRPYPTLLVVPDAEHLLPWARQQGLETSDVEALVRDPRVVSFLEQEALGRLQGLARYETPKKIAILPHEFTIESGELTPTLKVKRRVVEDRYRDVIEEMYGG